MNFRSILRNFFLKPVRRTRFLFLSFLLMLLIISNFSQLLKKYVKNGYGNWGLAPLPYPQLPESCEGRWIYIYNMDEAFNLEFVHNCSSFKKHVDLCPYMENSGMGRSFNYEPEVFEYGLWYNTWQFSLEVYFHERLQRYPCTTSTQETANAFYVPFYAGMDLTNRMTHPALRPLRQKLYLEVLEWLRQQHSFIRNGGLDHFVTLGRIALDFRRPKGDSWGTQMLLQPDFHNMVKLTLERDGSTAVYSNNEIAIPYPSYFHPLRDAHIQDLIQWSSREVQRTVFVSIVAGRRRSGQGGIREKLMLDCEKDDRCTVLICDGHEGVNQSDLTTRSFSFLPIAGHTLQESCSFPSIVIDVFHRSVFCLQPPGDSPSRRSFMDSLLAGCIPVIFKTNTAWSQYTAFLPEKGDVYSILVPIHEVRKESILRILEKIPWSKIQSMRAHIKHLLPRILYAHVERKYALNEKSGESVLERVDAFDITLNEVFSLMKKNLDGTY